MVARPDSDFSGLTRGTHNSYTGIGSGAFYLCAILIDSGTADSRHCFIPALQASLILQRVPGA